MSDLSRLGRLRQPGPLDVYFGHLRGLSDEAITDAERVFFGRLQLANGTFKTTAPHRLDDVNELALSVLPAKRPLRIMDVAVSSGVTSLEWSDQLRAKEIDHDLMAGDLTVEGVLLTAGRRIAVLWERCGHPLAIQLGERTAYLHSSGRLGVMAARLSPPLRALYRLVSHLGPAAAEAPPAPWTIRVRPVRLLAQRLRQGSPHAVICDDISSPARSREQTDVCRAANILNRSYFSVPEIQSMARNLLTRIRSGGILIVCRTIDSEGRRENQTTIFRLEDGTPTVVARLNGGSEVEDLVLSCGGPSANSSSAAPASAP